ncbi:Ribosomal protein S6 modification protein [Roseimaritima multifibrata]|uniref:Ribosomal protein S6 modification protein n=1 Tax=Roseimaritima multifibrata TaxID=1930274 RepID=A0A517MKY2_9BACT|nr:RimK family alpha-L-glutamate ligase [Roseimaritima multifibrata]QDS95539.1 Ribosomal protein S6 modification protein [Roseimaritima multifibrata]
MDQPAVPASNRKPLQILVLGPDEGWHADRLRSAAQAAGHQMQFARYETLAASLDGKGRHRPGCSLGTLESFDAILTRTMPTGSLEQITFRLATLHSLIDSPTVVVNPPRALETAIDKYATLTAVSGLGYDVPATVVVQSRREAMEAFERLGGDVVVKPLFGGEGRGVMRVQDPQLAWTTFATLERLDAVCYVQQFVPPGGIDTRYFVIGDGVWGIRRQAREGWRTNVSQGGQSVAVPVSESQRLLALRVARRIGIEIGSVDVLEASDGLPRVLEVNGVPGWKGAATALQIDLAAEMIRHVEVLVASRRNEFADIMEPTSNCSPFARPTE